MARIIHDTAVILDAAVRLLRRGSAADITVAAVIRESGVSSGSVYHRFGDRGALMGAIWNRSVQRFHSAAYPMFTGEPVEVAGRLARYTVEWSAHNPGDAQVLLAGVEQFAPNSWPADVRNIREMEQTEWNARIRTLIRGLRGATHHDTAALLLVVVDLPYAAVRRYLESGTPVPPNLAMLVETVVTSTLSRTPARAARATRSGVPRPHRPSHPDSSP